MKRLDFNKIKQKRWLLDKNAKIFRIEEAREFVERLGLVSTFTNEHLPSLARAIYNDDLRSRFEIDQRLWDYFHILLTKKWAYYSRILGDHNILVSIRLLPYYIRIYPIPDHHFLYDKGVLSELAKSVMDLLHSKGPFMTRQIREQLGLSSPSEKKKLTQALTELQRRSLICCSGKIPDQHCGWRCGVWSPTDAWVPRRVKVKARAVNEEEARRKLVEKYVYSTTRTTIPAIARFFNWPWTEVQRIIISMIDRELISSYNHQGEEYLFKGNL
jgi:hypothetical protein